MHYTEVPKNQFGSKDPKKRYADNQRLTILKRQKKRVSDSSETLDFIWWSLQGMILRPPDYESGALTN